MNVNASAACMEYIRMRPAGSCMDARLKKGAWSAQEDRLLKRCIDEYGEGKWHLVPIKAGLNRCRKSCRLRWVNYLKPNIKKGEFGDDEVDLILRMHRLLGNRWSLIAGRIPGRTANDVKNYWNTHLQPRPNKRKKEPKEKESSEHPAATSIIRPQPMNLPKTLNSHSCGNKGNAAANDDENSTKSVFTDDVDTNVNTSPGLTLSPVLLDDMISEYWDELFDDPGNNCEVGTSFGGALAEGESSIGFLGIENGQASLLDFCLDD